MGFDERDQKVPLGGGVRGTLLLNAYLLQGRAGLLIPAVTTIC